MSFSTPNWKLQSPCKDCSDRFVGCHSSCVKYIDYQQASSVRNREIHKKKKELNSGEYTDYIVGRHRERNRKKFRGEI